MEIAIVLGLLLAAILLFSWEKITVDTVTLMMLVILIATKILTPAEAFSGFGSDFIIILGSIFVISGALQQTGVLDLIGSKLLKVARTNPLFLITYSMIAVGLMSAFMNNTTVTAIFIAPIITVARRMKVSPSKLLMPVAYASILGGTCTLIGTSTNVAVSGYLKNNGLADIGMFDFLPIGFALFVTGLLYMVLIGKRLLPDIKEEGLAEEFKLKDYVSEIVVSPGSELIGQEIFKSSLNQTGFRILNVIRDGRNFMPDYSTLIHEKDILIVEGNIDDLMKVKETTGIDIRADKFPEAALQSEHIKLAEVLVTQQSEFLNDTLKRSSFRQKYGLVVLAINRTGQTISQKLGNVKLHVGDILLIQGPSDKINYLKSTKALTILEDFKPLLYRKRKGILTLILFIAGIVAGTTGLLPLSASLLMAAITLILSKIISVEKAYETIDWRLLILIGGMTAFGVAMKNSGSDIWLAEKIVSFLLPFGLIAIMAGFIILTVFLTQPMSNAAAALVVLPVAIETANQVGANPVAFGIAVMLSASVSLITPFEPSCILVWGPGKYRFYDFFKTGFLITILLMAVLLIMIPWYWPLK
ncbi:MAG: potassium transporter TrkA [Bacteroidetes bacterium]|nr:MAG: potassium transporter TrkA [Bacteroidota bacterium]REK00773.1 MAG: potassium transporter TrkA [Bacteroidota bacterium]REK35021.1 MAG: potassium transporter TrkA [Bacteroidota bacterium]REK48180.1 MAG: potassium transporter TrkA [Bacteroidota bacterium]